jgi:hypothetical protein
LKPSSTVSLMKSTSEDRRSAQAMTLMPATTSAVSEAIATKRAGSPAAMTATVVPTSSEIAEVGPIASCFEVPNSAYAIPATR